MEEQEGETELSWETACVVSGRLFGIHKSGGEITIETEGEDDEWFEEDSD